MPNKATYYWYIYGVIQFLYDSALVFSKYTFKEKRNLLLIIKTDAELLRFKRNSWHFIRVRLFGTAFHHLFENTVHIATTLPVHIILYMKPTIQKCRTENTFWKLTETTSFPMYIFQHSLSATQMNPIKTWSWLVTSLCIEKNVPPDGPLQCIMPAGK